MIRVDTSGSFEKTLRYLHRVPDSTEIARLLDRYGQMGVAGLASATPLDTGETANSWTYSVTIRRGKVSIEWYNTHVENGAVIAVLIQYGHGTKNGGFVVGQDYINPVMRPLFDQIAADIWKKVTRDY